MTPQAQRIAIAEACGWRPCKCTNPLCECWMPPDRTWLLDATEPPDYLNDLNAMREAMAVLTDEQRAAFAGWVEAITSSQVSVGSMSPDGATDYTQLFKCINAAASQLAEAFLRTLNRWDNSK